jgi:amidase
VAVPDPFSGLVAHVEALDAGTTTSAELVDGALARIDAAQPTINAFRCVRADAAREEAADADRRRAAGERAPLLGVPVAIKDDVDLLGESTPFGCRGNFPTATADCEMVRRLRSAGAVIVGKTTTPEFGQWPIAEGLAFGVTRNPWSLEHTPGGSSGGAAAAVAAGLVPAAIGSDGAGSVRIPAAWTHLVGIKPQRGRISTWPDADAFNGLACLGPLARNVADAALLLDVVTGNHAGDRHRPPAPSESFAAAARRDPGRLRIALSLRNAFSGVPTRLHPEVRAAVERIAAVLRELGHDVTRAEPRYGLVGLSIFPRGLAGLHDWARRVPDVSLLDHRTRGNVRVGGLLRGPALRAARAAEGPLQRRIGRIFNHADVVLAPTTAQPPLAVGALDGLKGYATDRVAVGACPFAWPWNVLGWPGINVPAGFTGDGRPLGVQLLGPANAEPMLLALAAQLETVERWQDRRPPVAGARSPR